MTALHAPLEVVQVASIEDDDDVCHVVCHCTEYNTSSCGLDVSALPMGAQPDEQPCPLCFLVWPDDSPTCPWDCACEECGPANP